MFIGFSVRKLRYERAQTFPFLIAILCVVIILIMITVNLGQIGIFKTDVSNAADAGALAGASVLSGSLMGLGLKSDGMVGRSMAMVVFALLMILTVIGIGVGIAALVAILISQIIDWAQAMLDGCMAWTSAKKTALQYAFQNAGVDEPRLTFKQFLRTVYGVTDPDSVAAGQMAIYYDEYVAGDCLTCASGDSHREEVRRATQGGFSRFLEDADSANGFWHAGEIEPGAKVDVILTRGYGWGQRRVQQPDGSFVYVDVNSFDDGNVYGNYNGGNYDNYVEVEAISIPMYPLGLFNPAATVIDAFTDMINDALAGLPWWLSWITGILTILFTLISGIIRTLMPMGLTFGDGTEATVAGVTDNAYVMVTARRFKRDNNLGLWNFRYGGTNGIASTSRAHAFREGRFRLFPNIPGLSHITRKEGIEPAFTLNGNCVLGDNAASMFGCVLLSAIGGAILLPLIWELFDSKGHLFETELSQ